MAEIWNFFLPQKRDLEKDDFVFVYFSQGNSQHFKQSHQHLGNNFTIIIVKTNFFIPSIKRTCWVKLCISVSAMILFSEMEGWLKFSKYLHSNFSQTMLHLLFFTPFWNCYERFWFKNTASLFISNFYIMKILLIWYGFKAKDMFESFLTFES